jgi:putative transposase
LGNVVTIDEGRLKDQLAELLHGTVEETFVGMLEAEADARVEPSATGATPSERTTGAGSYDRKLHTRAGDVTLKMQKLRRQPFEMAFIGRYRRRETSIDEALIEMHLAGLSVRRVEDMTEPLWGTRVNFRTVSKLDQRAHKHMETWRAVVRHRSSPGAARDRFTGPAN